MFIGIKNFCKTNPKSCSIAAILSNIWWRIGIISVLFLRILSNFGELIYYASTKNEDSEASNESAETLYEAGEDFGTIMKYILDFRTNMDTTRSEFDVMG